MSLSAVFCSLDIPVVADCSAAIATPAVNIVVAVSAATKVFILAMTHLLVSSTPRGDPRSSRVEVVGEMADRTLPLHEMMSTFVNVEWSRPKPTTD